MSATAHHLADAWRWRIVQETTREDECWVWPGRLDHAGYGRTTYGRVLEQLAHRLSYRLFVGEITKGLTLDHLCRNKACVNPDHLEAVTARVNILRGDGVAAKRARQTHCVHGHEFSPGNTYVYSNGRRECRTCRAARSARVYAATKARVV